MRRIQASWSTLVVVAAGLALVVVVAMAVIWPWPWNIYVEHVLLRDAMASAWPKPPAPSSIAGCYSLEFGDWIPSADLGGDECFINAPAAVELTTTPRAGRTDTFMMLPAGASQDSIHRWSSWSVTPERKVRLVWSTGFAGVTAELGPAGGVLRGTASTFWDFPRTTQWARLTATPTECGKPSRR